MTPLLSKTIRQVRSVLRRPQMQYEVLRWIREWQKKGLATPGDYLEFGCYKGASATSFYTALKAHYPPESLPKDQFHMYLFDSFEGLPASSHAADLHPKWEKGTFDVGGAAAFASLLDQNHIPRDRYTQVAGFYETSLPAFRSAKLQSAAFINLDCDYYTSTKVALEFCKDKMRNFTVLYFDDLYSFSGHPGKGQLLAIKEFNEENKGIGITPCPVLDYASPGRLWWVWKD